MSRNDFRHGVDGEAPNPLSAKDLGHLFVGDEELHVSGVLQVVHLEVGPQLPDALSPGGHLLSDDDGKIIGQLHGLIETGSLSRLGKEWFRFFLG